MTAVVWNAIHAQRRWGSWPPESIVSYFCRTFPTDRRQIRVLDLGCGAGACTRMLVDEGFSVTAIDCSMDALAQVRHGLRKWQLPHCDIFCGDITEPLQFVDASFDVVLDNLTLSHIEDAPRAAVVREIHRVLKPGGRFITRRFKDGSDPIIGRGFVHYCTNASLTAEASGLFAQTDFWFESIRGIKIASLEYIRSGA